MLELELSPVFSQECGLWNTYSPCSKFIVLGRDGHGRVWQDSDPDPFIFLDPDPDPDPKGPKFSDPDPDPADLIGSRVLNGSYTKPL